MRVKKNKFERKHTLVAQANLIDEFGRTGAQFINQIHYWLQKNNVGIVHDDKKWIYNTAEEWAEQLRVSSRTIRNYIRFFLNKQIIQIEKLSKHKSNRTNFITLNYQALEGLNIQNKKEKSAQPLGKKCTMVIHKITNIDKNNKSIETALKNKIVQVEENLCVDKNIKEKGRGEPLSNTILQKPSNTTVQDMLKDWNKVFPESQVVINKELAKHLFAAFSLKCDKNMMKWKNYLDRLKSSEFIMSDKFKLSLDWALKFKTIDRIFKGDLGVKDIAIQLNQASEEKKSMDHIENTEESLKCQYARSLILSKIGAIKYNAWFTKVNFVEREGRVQMKAETKFVEDYVMQHFGHLFL